MESSKQCRGVRGATVVPHNSTVSIVSACAELFAEMTRANGIEAGDIAAIVFTTTPDLGAAFPAQAAHVAGFERVPRICAQEIDVPGALARCLRILVLWNTKTPADAIEHCYRNGAEALTLQDEQGASILGRWIPEFPGR